MLFLRRVDGSAVFHTGRDTGALGWMRAEQSAHRLYAAGHCIRQSCNFNRSIRNLRAPQVSVGGAVTADRGEYDDRSVHPGICIQVRRLHSVFYAYRRGGRGDFLWNPGNDTAWSFK